MRRSTGIKILPGAAGKKAKLLAEQTAKAMEQTATGEKLRGKRHAVSPKSFHSIRHSVVTYLRDGMTGVSLFSADAVRDAVGHDSEEVECAYFAGSLAARGRVVAELAAVIAIPAKAEPTATPSPYTRQA